MEQQQSEQAPQTSCLQVIAFVLMCSIIVCIISSYVRGCSKDIYCDKVLRNFLGDFPLYRYSKYYNPIGELENTGFYRMRMQYNINQLRVRRIELIKTAEWDIPTVIKDFRSVMKILDTDYLNSKYSAYFWWKESLAISQTYEYTLRLTNEFARELRKADFLQDKSVENIERMQAEMERISAICSSRCEDLKVYVPQ